MNILQRYYLKEFFKIFGIVCAGLSIVLSLIELIGRLDNFMPHNPKMSSLMLYSALHIPHYALYLMPPAALIGGLFVFSQAGNRRETVAIKASGYGIKSLLMPFVFTGMVLSIAAFMAGEFISADAMNTAARLRDALSKKDDLLTLEEGTTWMKTKNAIVKIDIYMPDKGIIKGVSIMKIRNDALTERIEADSGEWKPAIGSPDDAKKGVWYLKGVTVYKINEGIVKKMKEYPLDEIDSPEILRQEAQRSDSLRDTMNVRDLIKYTNRLKEAGFKNISFLVDIHSKISYPVINLIMLVLGISLAVRGEMMGGLMTVAAGIAVSLLYLFGFSIAISMGYAGILSPFVAAWIMPLIFGAGAWRLFRNLPE